MQNKHGKKIRRRKKTKTKRKIKKKRKIKRKNKIAIVAPKLKWFQSKTVVNKL